MSVDSPPERGRDDESTVFEWDEGTEVGIAIAESVAAVAGVDPVDLEPRVNDVVDPDALDRALRSAHSGASFAFPFGDYLVTVWSDGEVVVSEAD